MPQWRHNFRGTLQSSGVRRKCYEYSTKLNEDLTEMAFNCFFLTTLWSKTFLSSFSDTANGTRLFETDIKLSPLDFKRVDTSLTGNAPGADVEVQNIEKRKAIRTRRKIWPSRVIPVVLTVRK